MAQLWGGRFTKETDQLVYNFNASISFDQKFYRQDIEGSMAHVRMLGKQGILTQDEAAAIVAELKKILSEIEAGTLEIAAQFEDIHSFVEAKLIERLGKLGKSCIPEGAVTIRWRWICGCMSAWRLGRPMRC